MRVSTSELQDDNIATQSAVHNNLKGLIKRSCNSEFIVGVFGFVRGIYKNYFEPGTI
jgi:hypothetical protein